MVAEQGGEAGSPPRTGDVGKAVARVSAGRRLLPQVLAELHSEEAWAVGLAGQEVALELQCWTFLSPWDRAVRPGPRAVRVVPGTDDPREAVILGTFLRDVGQLRPGDGDLLSAGLRALGLQVPGDPVPGELVGDPGDTAGELGCKMLGRQVLALAGSLPGTIRDLDPEYLHDLRVATRRARFALQLFAPWLADTATEDLRCELSWLTRTGGKVRDLDVFGTLLGEGLPRVGASDEVKVKVCELLRERRRSALAELIRSLESPRCRELGVRLAQVSPAAGGTLAVAAAPGLVGVALARIRRWDSRFGASPSHSQLHRLRICFKGLRYTTEFFSELFGESVARAIRRCVRFQDCLGAHQDAAIALAMLEELTLALESRGEADREVFLAMGALMQLQRESARRQRRRFRRLWSHSQADLDALEQAVTVPS
jgi:CHAD domain-containing protein